jgi:hypothetical protein
VTVAPRKVATNPRLMQLRPRGRPSVFSGGCSPLALGIMVLTMMIPVTLYLLSERFGQLGREIFEWAGGALAIGVTGLIFFSFPATLIYYAYFRPLPNSRQLRERAPEARQQRG